MNNKSVIVRSTTGKYHIAIADDSLNVTYCNYSGQCRRQNNRLASELDVQKANKTSFCKKCFGTMA